MSFKLLRILFIVSIGVLLFIVFSPYLIPELLPNTADKINIILTRLCYAYIGSFIFYYLVVYLKNKRDKNNTSEFVSIYIKYIYYNYKQLIGAIYPKNAKNKIEFPDEEKLKELLMKLDPNSEAPLVMGVNHKRADWFEYLDYIYDRHHNYLTKLETLIPHLSTELIKILVKLDFKTNRSMNFVWHRSWQNANNKPYHSLEFVTGSLSKYTLSIELLKEYYEKNHGDIKDINGTRES